MVNLLTYQPISSLFCPRPYERSLFSPAFRFCETSCFRNPGIYKWRVMVWLSPTNKKRRGNYILRTHQLINLSTHQPINSSTASLRANTFNPQSNSPSDYPWAVSAVILHSRWTWYIGRMVRMGRGHRRKDALKPGQQEDDAGYEWNWSWWLSLPDRTGRSIGHTSRHPILLTERGSQLLPWSMEHN